MGNSILWNLLTARGPAPVIAAGIAAGSVALVTAVGIGLARSAIGRG